MTRPWQAGQEAGSAPGLTLFTWRHSLFGLLPKAGILDERQRVRLTKIPDARGAGSGILKLM